MLDDKPAQALPVFGSCRKGAAMTKKSLADELAEGAAKFGPVPAGFEETVAKLTRELPEPAVMSNGEVEGLQREALDGYLYGERERYDVQGRRWSFRREPIDDQWQMVVRVEFFGIPLGAGMVPLDRVAGKDGEDRMLAEVEHVAEMVTFRQKQAVKAQKLLRTEADEAVAPLMEPATSTAPMYDPAAPAESDRPEMPNVGTEALAEAEAEEKRSEPATKPEPPAAEVKQKPPPEPEKHKRRW